MKKILFFLILFFVPFVIYAETRLTTTTQTPLVGDKIIIRLMLNYEKNRPIKEAHYLINYDPMYLSIERIMYPQSEANVSYENGQIKVDKIANSPSEYWQEGSQLMIEMKVLKAGTIPIKVSENGRAKYYDDAFISQIYHGITLNASEPSSDTTIYSLKVKDYLLVPGFSQNTHEYTLVVPSDVDEVEITATKGEQNQNITGIGKKKLEYGPNRVTVNVIAQNGNISTYVIMITRTDNRNGDTSLKQVKIGDVIATYNDKEEVYYATISKSTSKAILVGQPTDSNATVVGNGEKTLEIGKNIFELTVESSNNVTKKYKIVIERESVEREIIDSSTKLKSLSINNMSIDLSNDKTVIAFGTKEDEDMLSITALPESSTAKVDIQNIELKPGPNTVSIKVTETDGKTQEYTIIAYKPFPNYTKIDSFEKLPSTKTIAYNIGENSSHIINATKDLKNMELLYNVVNLYNAPLYIVKFNNINMTESIDASFNFKNNDNNNLLYNTALPEKIEISLYVGEYFANNTYLKIYTYNDGEQKQLLTEAVKVTDGYINFTTNGKINYVFSTTDLTNNVSFNYKQWILPIALGLLIIILLIVGLTNKKKKKVAEPSY